MVKIGLLPKNVPFNPEELTNNLPKGEVVFYQSSKFTVLGISGSCKDERGGTKSIFWLNEFVSFSEIIQRVLDNNLAQELIKSMPFKINWPDSNAH
jgi:hypothetical protein